MTPGLSCSVASSWTRDWIYVSCIGRWILIHWTTREVPALSVFNMIAKKFKITFGTLEAATLSYICSVCLFIWFSMHLWIPAAMSVFQVSLEMSIHVMNHVRHTVSSSAGGVCPGVSDRLLCWLTTVILRSPFTKGLGSPFIILLCWSHILESHLLSPWFLCFTLFYTLPQFPKKKRVGG